MKNLTPLTFFLSFFLVVLPYSTVLGQQPNGGVITLSGDTLPCTIALKPKDAGLKNQRGAYRYDYVIALFKNDSVRIIYPGTIKAFYVKWRADDTSPTSWYVSDTINETHDMLIKNPKFLRPVFLQRLVTGGYYHLWYFEQIDHGSHNDRIFILEENSTGKHIYFYRTRQLKKLLGNWPENKRQGDYKDWFKGKQLMVMDYNKYKAGK